MSEKIGIGIITKQPRETFEKTWKSVYQIPYVNKVYVVNDGEKISDWFIDGLFFRPKSKIGYEYHHNRENIGVGKSKNILLKHFLENKYDHVFLIEDDIFIKDESVFQKYIEASKRSGIQHFNFSQHGLANKLPNGDPNPRYVVNYNDCEIAFYPHCVGAFSYYSRRCLEECGLMDEDYYNACEHVDHTYEIIKKGMHPPFWYFADIQNSWEYLGDDGWSIEKSSICSAPDFRDNVIKADQIFVKKHGHLPTHTPMATEEQFYTSLKDIKRKYE
jgi:GT2 family glycosyltransferase